MKVDRIFIYALGGGIAAAATAFWLGWTLGSHKHDKVTGEDTKKEEFKAEEPKKTSLSVTRVLAISMGGTSSRFGICERKKDENGLVTIDIVKKDVFRTTTPAKLIEDLKNFTIDQDVQEVGIASFGPLCLDKDNEDYGNILPTPKGLWNNFPLLNQVQTISRQKNSFIDTDVNAAALAEFRKGNHGAKESLVYITVGTGIGVGLVTHGKPVHGLTHPEGGHIIVQPDKEDADFKGVCPFHNSCVEAYATNNAIAKRLGKTVDDLPEIPKDHDVWRRVAYYLAQVSLNVTLLVSPEVIIIGGGVVKQETLLPRVREYFLELLAGYVQHDLFDSITLLLIVDLLQIETNIESYIKLPALGDDVEIIGAALLSQSE